MTKPVGTILNRVGKKSKIMNELLHLFPKHETYIELFMGSGSVFFSKPLAKYNILNDLDSDVTNLFLTIQSDFDELYEAVELMPYSQDLFKYWMKNKPKEPIMRAARFLFLSNYTLYGKMDTVKFASGNNFKKILLSRFKGVFDKLKFAQITGVPATEALRLIQFRENSHEKTFIYSDPPFLETTNNYADNCQFTEDNSAALFKYLVESNCKFGMSEFDHPFILEQAKMYGLIVHIIGERKNLGNRRTEIYISNYEIKNQTKLF